LKKAQLKSINYKTVKKNMKYAFITFFLSISILYNSVAQVKILFNASKAESAANADWVIDADKYNVGYGTGVPTIGGSGTEANAQRIPTPAQSGITATTAENYWSGGLSAWAVECVKKGYTVESLPIGTAITFGNATNPQDLSNYQVYVVCEPNILFTASEKTAILKFVEAGGGLFMVGNHDMSDRNFDGFDSPAIWNDLMSNNTVKTNPFGFTFNAENLSQTSTNVLNATTHPILKGAYGNVTKIKTSGGNSLTINTSQNTNVQGLVFKNAQTASTNNVLAASSTFGNGRVFVICDSSLPDDGTGDVNDVLYDGWVADADGNHRKLIMNATVWLATTTYPTLVASKKSVKNIDCFGNANGSITLDVSGGNNSYTYLWSNGATSNPATNLAAGKYSVTVSSIAGVTPVVLKDIEVTAPIKLEAFVGGSSVLDCKTISIIPVGTASGGIPPYTYNWLNINVPTEIKKAGTYTLVVTDNNGCSASKSFAITQDITAPDLTIKNENITCAKPIGKLNAASITTKVTFEWSGPNNFKAFQKDTSTSWSGTYSVTATNTLNSCTTTKTVNVLENLGNPPMLVTLKYKLDASDIANGGRAQIEVTKGTPPYHYIWKDKFNKKIGTDSSFIEGLTKGVYVCEITDANGCKTNFTVIINQVLSAQDMDNQESIIISPNPFSNHIMVKSEDSFQFDLYTIEGKKVLSATTNQYITTDSLPQGVYLIKLKEKQGVKRLVKM
jgi:hypothetical protein